MPDDRYARQAAGATDGSQPVRPNLISGVFASSFESVRRKISLPPPPRQWLG